MCIYINIHACTYTYIAVHIHILTLYIIHACTYMYVHVYWCTYTCMYMYIVHYTLYMYVCMYPECVYTRWCEVCRGVVIKLSL